MDEHEIRFEEGGAGCSLTLRGTIDVRVAAPLHEAALRACRAAGPVRIDCRDVERLDYAGIQILLALRRELAVLGRELRLVAVPEATERLLRLAGLATILGGDREREAA